MLVGFTTSYAINNGSPTNITMISKQSKTFNDLLLLKNTTPYHKNEHNLEQYNSRASECIVQCISAVSLN
jgi:hypothetical protein